MLIEFVIILIVIIVLILFPFVDALGALGVLVILSFFGTRGSKLSVVDYVLPTLPVRKSRGRAAPTGITLAAHTSVPNLKVHVRRKRCVAVSSSLILLQRMVLLRRLLKSPLLGRGACRVHRHMLLAAHD